MPWFNPGVGFGSSRIERNRGIPSTSLLGAASVPFVAQVVVHSAQQIGTKAAPCRIGPGDGIRCEEAREEALCQIERRLRIMALASDVSIDWRPISSAKLGEGIAAFGILTPSGLGYETPARSREGLGARSGRILVGLLARQVLPPPKVNG